MRNIHISQIVKATKGEIIFGNFNDEISHISIDSRDIKNNTLFVAIIGEKKDAHDFISQVFENGGRLCIVSRRDIDYIEGMTYILVKDTIEALQEIALFYRQGIKIPLVAVTGSVGKTTTREMVAAALSQGMRVFKTPANFNSQIGVPLTIFSIDDKAQIGIIEMGISIPGEMERIARIVSPDVAIITNIGVTHIELLGSRENIMLEKSHIQDFMEAGSAVYLNSSDDLLREAFNKREELTYRYFSDDIKYSKQIYAKNIAIKDGLANFTACIDDDEIEINLSVYGTHQVINAVVALAVAKHFNVDLDIAKKGLENFRGFKHRQQILKKGNIRIIDDTYNASPVSMKAAIQILEDIKAKGRKVAVLADMKELGADEELFHKEVGRFLAEKKTVNIIYSLGKLAKCLALEAKHYNDEIEVFDFLDKNELDKFILDTLEDDDVLLFKGSNSMKLSDSVDMILND